MARARNIKPAIMDNEALAELPALTRLLFVYMWMLADREGRLEDRPKRIAAQALPYDRAADIDEMLAALTAGGFIQRFTAAGKAVIQVVTFRKHQTPHGTEKDSDLPDADGLFSVHERGKNGYATGLVLLKDDLGTVVRQVSNKPLTVKEHPDTGFTDSLIPDSPNHDPGLADPSSPGAGAPGGGDEAGKAAKPRKKHGTEDDHKAVRWMFHLVLKVDATAKEPNWDAWANEMRLMREQDGRSHVEACELFKWANADTFWRANILSPAKLREQWQQLTLKRAATPQATKPALMSDEQRQAANDDSTAEALRILRAANGAPPLTPEIPQ